jgi:SET domain-containing protein
MFVNERLKAKRVSDRGVTTQYSFVLRPSSIAGVGVFSTHEISSGTPLRLFVPDEKLCTIDRKSNGYYFAKWFGVEVQDEYSCPEDFGRMSVGWYLNHSSDPNAYHMDYNYYALRDIDDGEEITIDYHQL